MEDKLKHPYCSTYSAVGVYGYDSNRRFCEGAFRSVVAFDRLNGVGQCTVTFDRQDLSTADEKVFSYNTRLSLHLG
ncbi:MAG: hypothetical protein LBV17_03340, partial [Treponema sp.]|nr:hypothetical protein [Treponema sp.]